MGESRKSDYTGDVFGDWVVIGRGDGEGDRKRRWVVKHQETGVEMTVLQTGLTDLALAKRLAQRAAEADAARLSPEQAEEQLLARLDQQIGATLVGHLMLGEARASVALDHDPECQTYSLETIGSWRHPFNDEQTRADQELAAGDPFALSATTLALLAEGAEEGVCPDCESGNHPDLSPTSGVGYLELQKAAIEAQLGVYDRTFTKPDIRPMSAIETGMGFVEPSGVLMDVAEFKMILFRAAAKCVKAQEEAKAAEHMICDILEGLLP